MDRKIDIGQPVTLNSAFGLIDRIVVSVHDGMVLVCLKDEYEAASRERREPVTMAFPLSDVVSEAH